MKRWSAQLAWSLLCVLEPSQGCSSHGSLKHIAPSSPAVVFLSLTSDSFTIPFSPTLPSEGAMSPLHLGSRTLWVHRSKRGPGKGQAAAGAQAGLTPHLNNGWASPWEPLVCRLSMGTGTSMENSTENAPVLVRLTPPQAVTPPRQLSMWNAPANSSPTALLPCPRLSRSPRALCRFRWN